MQNSTFSFTDVQLEAALIGKLLNDPEFFDSAIIGGLDPDLFSIVTDDEGKTHDNRQIVAELMKLDESENRLGGLTKIMPDECMYLANCMTAETEVIIDESSIKELRELAANRTLYDNIGRLRTSMEQRPGDKEHVAKNLETIVQTFSDMSESQSVPLIPASQWLATPEPEPEKIIDDWLDSGDCAFVVGPSKVRKTFFCLQMAISVAVKLPFLGFGIQKPRRVAYFQLEVTGHHFQKRLSTMCMAMGVKYTQLGNLFVFNLRGANESKLSEDSIKAMIRLAKADVVFIDPAYLLIGDENDQAEAKQFVKRLARISSGTGAALVCVFHTAKSGVAGREAIDAAAGSGVFGRSCDSQFVLAPHEEGGEYVVLQTVTRNYKSPDDQTLRFADGCFVRDDLLPVLKKPGLKTEQAEKIKLENVNELFGNSDSMNQTMLKQKMKELGIPQSKMDNQISSLLKAGLLEENPERGARGARIFRRGKMIMSKHTMTRLVDDSDMSGIDF